MNKQIICFLVFIMTFSSNLFAQIIKKQGGRYEFKGREYQLNPYQDAPPKGKFGFVMEEGLEKNLSNYPQRLNLKQLQTPVKDQGSRGSCAYFSAVALAESAIKSYQGDVVNISEEYLIKLGKGLFGRFAGDDGSVAYYNLYDLKEGFGLEKDFPYQFNWFKRGLPCQSYDEKSPETPDACFSHFPPSEEEQEKAINFDGLEIVPLQPSAENIAAWMGTYNHSIVVGLPVNKNGWNGETGYAYHNESLRRECQTNKDICGGHSIVLTGYNLRSKTFTFKNSWGKDWGRSGYGTLSFSYINNYLQGNPIAAYLTEAVNLPRNHNRAINSPKLENLKYSITNDENYLTLNLYGNISNKLGHIITISSTMTYREPGDSDFDQLIPVNPQYKKRYGKFLSDSFNFNFMRKKELDFNQEPLQLSIPYALIGRRILNNKELALRLSINYFSDTKGQVQVLRQFIPLQ